MLFRANTSLPMEYSHTSGENAYNEDVMKMHIFEGGTDPSVSIAFRVNPGVDVVVVVVVVGEVL